MSELYACPNCKKNLSITNNEYNCFNCNLFYGTDLGYLDFIPETDFYAGEVPKKEMIELINNIDRFGFNPSLDIFFKKYPHLRWYLFDKKRSDWIYNTIGKPKVACLDIGSGLGNISENLSRLFDHVYSVEAVKERIEFQRRRFRESNRSNIHISRVNVLNLPFKDKSFDFIVCNGVLEWIGMMNTKLSPRLSQINFLTELKRVLKDNGIIYIGIENRFGLPFLLGEVDHSGLKYTSIMPRFIANYVVKKHGNSGGIYGDTQIKKKEERGYFTYTYTSLGYKSLFREVGFRTNTFWTFPSYNQPYFNGNLDDKIALKGFINYISNANSNLKQANLKTKMALLIAKKINKSALKFFVSLLLPSFLFYCGKEDFELPILKYIMQQTGLTSYTSLSDGEHIKYLLYEKHSIPKKIVYMKRDIKNLPDKILEHNKTDPMDLPHPSENIWVENWIHGRKINPSNIDEVLMAFTWLTNFQQRNEKEIMNSEFFEMESNKFKDNISSIEQLLEPRYIKIVDDYIIYLKINKIKINSEHGDFWYGNVIVDNYNKINIIDWETFRERGDPFFDYVFFIILLIVNFRDHRFEHINEILNKKEIIKLKSFLDERFGFDVDLRLLITYNLLRFIVKRHNKYGQFDKELSKYYVLLEELSK